MARYLQARPQVTALDTARRSALRSTYSPKSPLVAQGDWSDTGQNRNHGHTTRSEKDISLARKQSDAAYGVPSRCLFLYSVRWGEGESGEVDYLYAHQKRVPGTRHTLPPCRRPQGDSLSIITRICYQLSSTVKGGSRAVFVFHTPTPQRYRRLKRSSWDL